MRINVTNLRSFLAVAQCGGYSAAARQFGIAQPTLSRQVRELEERYAVTLFDRSTRQVRLTPIGEQLLRIASRGFAEFEDADRMLRSKKQKALRIFSVRHEKLTRFIEIISAHAKGVGVQISVKPSAEVYDGLKSGACDFGFLTMPLEGGGVDAMEIGTYPVLAYVSPHNDLCDEAAISITQLDNRPVIIGSRATQTRRTFDREVEQAGITAPIVEEIDDFEVILAMARAGRGVGIVGCTGRTNFAERGTLRFREPGMSQKLHFAITPMEHRTALTNLLFNTFTLSLQSDAALLSARATH